MRLLEQMGHLVVPVDTTPWVLGGTRLFRFLAHRSNAGPTVWRLNEHIAAAANSLGPMDVVWIDRNVWIDSDTLMRLKEKTKATLVHYTPDPQLVHHKSRHFRAGIPLYDLVVTTKPFEVDLYREAGARKVLLVLQGYDPRFVPQHTSLEDHRALGSDVCFIGHCERHYAKRLRAASQACSQLRIWGPRWLWYARLHPWAKKHVAGNGIWGQRYPLALACSKIALGLLSKRIPETTTTRTFEIPATGVFLLAERTDNHLELFQEGIEAEFFGSDEELRDKITFYLNHDNLRKQIATAGYERCRRSGYASRNQLEKIFANIDR